MPPAITAKYDWILAITTIAFVFSAFGNGANDVANAYASEYTPCSVDLRAMSNFAIQLRSLPKR